VLPYKCIQVLVLVANTILPVVKQKWSDDGTIKFRVRGTAAGNLLDVSYDVSAHTASLDVVKMLLHSTISDNKKWFTIDIKDFYLGTPFRKPATNTSGLNARKYRLRPSPPTTSNPSSTMTRSTFRCCYPHSSTVL
jgi:hypothetical protein